MTVTLCEDSFNVFKRTMIFILVSAVTKNSSMLICANIIDRANSNESNVPDFREVKSWFIRNRIKSFYSPLFCSNFRQATSSLLQTAGLGKFRPNVLFLGIYSTVWYFLTFPPTP